MNNDKVIDLFNSDKVLVRAMDWPSLSKYDAPPFLTYNMSIFARELEQSMEEDGLTSASSTLLINGEHVPTYKPFGFLLNGETVSIEHVADSDSCSSGNVKSGDFYAGGKNYKTLENLSTYISGTHSNVMNEVNIGIKLDDIEGLFYLDNKKEKNLNLMYAILVQKFVKEFTSKQLPIYGYNINEGTLKKLEQTKQLEQRVFEVCDLKTNKLFYNVKNGEGKVISVDYKRKELER